MHKGFILDETEYERVILAVDIDELGGSKLFREYIGSAGNFTEFRLSAEALRNFIKLFKTLEFK